MHVGWASIRPPTHPEAEPEAPVPSPPLSSLLPANKVLLRSPIEVAPARGIGSHEEVSGRMEHVDGLDRVHQLRLDGGDLVPQLRRVDLTSPVHDRSQPNTRTGNLVRQPLEGDRQGLRVPRCDGASRGCRRRRPRVAWGPRWARTWRASGPCCCCAAGCAWPCWPRPQSA